MSIFDKFMHAMSFNDGNEDYDYDEDGGEYLDDEEEEEEPVQKKGFFGGRKKSVQVEEEAPKSSKSKITPMRQGKRRVDSNGREICMFKPTNENETSDIMDAIMSDRTVVLNLEGMHDDLAQRIIYTLSGCCYALSGNMLKISNYIFIVAPRSVELSGDAQGNVLREAFDLPMAAGGIL